MAGSNLAYIAVCRYRHLFWPTMWDMKDAEDAHPSGRYTHQLVQIGGRKKQIREKIISWMDFTLACIAAAAAAAATVGSTVAAEAKATGLAAAAN